MRRLPKYCIHKSRNLAFVPIGDREVYHGRTHSPGLPLESRTHSVGRIAPARRSVFYVHDASLYP